MLPKHSFVLYLSILLFNRFYVPCIDGTNAVKPAWFTDGCFAAAILAAQNHVTSHFVRSKFVKKYHASAFGINWANHLSTTVGNRHVSNLRLLLIISGDVEENPGPYNDNDDAGSSTSGQGLLEQSAEGNQHQCPHCSETFTRSDNLSRHIQSIHQWQTVGAQYPCEHCEKIFTRKDAHKRHQKIHKTPLQTTPKPTSFICSVCSKSFSRKANMERHEQIHIQPRPKVQKNKTEKKIQQSTAVQTDAPIQNIPAVQTDAPIENNPANLSHESNPELENLPQEGWELLKKSESAFRGKLASYTVQNGGDERDPLTYLESIIEQVHNACKTYLKHTEGIKLQMGVKMTFFKPTDLNQHGEAFFWSKTETILSGDDIEEKIRDCHARIISNHDKFIKNGSGWVDDSLWYAEVHFSKYQPLRAGCSVKLPKNLASKRAIVNVKNSDNRCFIFCIIASRIGITRNMGRPIEEYRKHIEDFDMTGIKYPVPLSQVKKFEQQNGMSINVYGYENHILPLYISKSTENEHVDLLLYKGHFFLIKNLDRLLSDQRSYNGKKFFCHKCLLPVYSKAKRDEHMEYCNNEEGSITRMAKDSVIKFGNVHKMQRRPVVVYADFEALTTEVAEEDQQKHEYQRHEPCSFGLLENSVCCEQSNTNEPIIYRGEDCISKFLEELVAIGMKHQENLNSPKELNPSAEEQTEFEASDTCYICKENFSESGFDKAMDHCHMCGKIRGALHLKCNISYRLDRDVTCIFHNLRRYDSHIIMQRIGETCQLFGFKLSVIPKSLKDYLSFTLTMPKDSEEKTESWRIRFIDSYQFLSASLDSLAKALPPEKFHAVRAIFEKPELIELMIRKGVYPYDYMNTWDRFNETELPPLEKFYSLLAECGISEQDYAHAKNVWNAFNLATLGDYHDLYLLTDVLILHDVFEAFRELSLKTYELDAAHYITLPSMAWDACLKTTKVELETIQDVDMYQLYESGIRGGISVVTKRHAIANNELCPDYNEDEEKSWLIYLDANNLYGWAMSQKLPVNGFKWLTEDELRDFDLTALDPNSDIGYILEVDIEYPEELHESHNDYPLLAEQMHVTEELLSPFCRYIRNAKEEQAAKVTKLVPNLNDKERYVIHSWMLHLVMELGLKVKKLHRGVKFNQSAWMEPYIRKNTELRKLARTEFEKSLFKLLNNSVFGKTMENVRLRKEIKLSTSEQQTEKLVANPRYRNHVIFNENLAAIGMAKKYVRLDKPIYVGLTVLELSKILMYEFHYKHMVPKYGNNLELMFSDTDSFVYNIKTENIYGDMGLDLDLYDTSDYPEDHFLHSNVNKKVIGKMKDELSGVVMQEFVGLKPKMYSFLVGGQEKKRAKGIKKCTIKNHLTFAQYKKCVLHYARYKHDMRFIRSYLHEIYSIHINKVSLTPYDNKRYVLSDGINTLAHGHYKIAQIDENEELMVEELMKERERETENMDVTAHRDSFEQTDTT